MSFDLISDASYLSDEGMLRLLCPSAFCHITLQCIISLDVGECGNSTKQVRFDLHSQSARPSGDSLPRDTLELSVEDETDSEDPLLNPSQPCPTPPSQSLDLSVLDESQLSKEMKALSLDVPQINTVRALQEEVIKLASRVHRAKNSVSCSS